MEENINPWVQVAHALGGTSGREGCGWWVAAVLTVGVVLIRRRRRSGGERTDVPSAQGGD